MHPERGIICTYIRSGGISTRTYGPNTLTRQSSGTNDYPRHPLFGPIKRRFTEVHGKGEGCVVALFIINLLIGFKSIITIPPL